MDLLLLVDKQEAENIISFLCGPNAFHWPVSEGEKKSIRERVINSLKKEEFTKYWYYKNDNGKVIGAGAIEKLPDTKDGYFLGWFAVHKDYRRRGLGRKIVEKVEEYARSQNGRFITIDTGEDNKAQTFYEKVGYKRVGFIPEYFEDKIAKIIYYKKL
ncbi:MAG: GNAT family N-acetyltransferase [bacterium]|nr:GNAT family N-acetyltransferase [bacterium]